jgi:hypothetical protein
VESGFKSAQACSRLQWNCLVAIGLVGFEMYHLNQHLNFRFFQQFGKINNTKASVALDSVQRTAQRRSGDITNSRMLLNHWKMTHKTDCLQHHGTRISETDATFKESQNFYDPS